MEIPWQDLEAALPNIPSFAAGAIAEARQFTCGLGRNYESYFVGPSALDPLGALRRSLVDKICGSPPPSPPAPFPPYGGDTCACELYDVSYISGQGPNPDFPENSTRVLGPIFGLQRTTIGEFTAMRLTHGSCSDGVLTGVATTDLIFGASNVRARLTGIRRVNLGGSPGVCIVPRPTPEPPIIPPPPEAQRQPVQITIAPQVAVSVPIVLVRPEINVRPDIDIEVNVGPLNINFNLGGVRIDLAPGLPPSPPGGGGTPLPPLPPDTPRPPALPPVAVPDCPDPCPELDLDEVLMKLDGLKELALDIKDCACEPPFVERSQVLGSTDGGTFALPEFTYRLRVDVNVISSNPKIEFGRNSAPDVYYCGWYALGRGTHMGDRRPLSYLSNEFLVDPEQNQFSFTVRAGYNAVVTAIYKEEVEE